MRSLLFQRAPFSAGSFLPSLFKKSAQLEYDKEQLRLSKNYNKLMAEQYDEMRKFRHDYKNMLLGLEGFIKDQEWQGLTDYFNTQLKPAELKVDYEQLQLTRLANITNPDIRNLIFAKLAYAGSQKVNFTVEIQSPVQLKIPAQLALVRILGIVLDNAIEELIQLTYGILGFAIIEQPNQVIILIQNNYRTDIESVTALRQKGYSTKGKQRGLGLHNLNELMKYSDVSINSRIEHGVFEQEIIIRKELLKA